MFTRLSDKTLWFDGSYSLTEDQLCDRMLMDLPLDRCFVEELTSNIKKYNLISDKPIEVKYSNDNIKTVWNIPEKYLHINILDHCLYKLNYIEGDEEYKQKAKSRIEIEADFVDKMNMSDLFRCIIYLVDYFNENNIVWGVGRGSSCASYILYVIGLHCVDCIKYDINFKEFFR
jgi:DNA polymerase III alpha subunit